MERLVVVGASLAGLRAAQAARAGGFTGELIVIGEEPHHPYTRPPLSKELLQGVQTPEQCALPRAKLEVDWRLGTPAERLDRARKQVVLAGGETIAYDRAILATGSRAKPWPGPGGDLHGVVTLRRLDDALALKATLVPGSRLVIVGAGFIGCEVAASARKLGVEVTMVDIADHPMLPLGSELGQRCGRVHAEHGVDLRCSTAVRAFHGAPHVTAVELSDGTTVPADTVLIALGAEPAIDWLTDSGLDLDPGVVCDATLTTLADPDVLVAGDIVSWPHRLLGGERVRVEHWTTAAEHGQLAGRNALLDPAERESHDAPPYFWSDQYDLKIQAVGFPGAAEQLEIVEATPEGDRLVAIGARGGALIAAVGFNAARRLTWYRRQLTESPDFDRVRELILADEGALGAPAARAGGPGDVT